MVPWRSRVEDADRRALGRGPHLEIRVHERRRRHDAVASEPRESVKQRRHASAKGELCRRQGNAEEPGDHRGATLGTVRIGNSIVRRQLGGAVGCGTRHACPDRARRRIEQHILVRRVTHVEHDIAYPA